MSGVLVTGASGFVGLPVLAQLARDGREVHALSTLRSPPRAPGVHWHRVDLGDREAVGALMGEVAPEMLMHLAWHVQHGSFWNAPENVLWVERSLSLVRAFALAGGRRAVLVGRGAAYDWAVARAPLRETDSPLAPSSLYGVAKDALHRVACAFAKQEGFELAWGRLFYLYGPREAPGRLVPSVIRKLLAGEIVDTTSGKQRLDFLHVQDVAGALVALLESGVVGAVNIASGQAVAVAEVVKELASLIGRPDLIRLGVLPDRPGDPPLLLADVGRLRDEIGFRPHWKMSDGLADAVRWWKEREPMPGR
jgi:nucleoside-diphosphate-sugar epimerase